MKRIFGNQKDFDLYTAVARQNAVLDREAYSFIEDEIFWPQFKAYLKERFDYDYEPSLEAVDYHQYAGDFQKTISRHVSYNGRILFWRITDQFLEPDVWEFESDEIAECMNEWDRMQRMSLLDLIRWRSRRKLNE
jgi:hypothetical protein